MSQIRKYQPGGSGPGQATQTDSTTPATPAPKKYGKFILNGEELDVTDDLIRQFSTFLSSQPSSVQSSLVDVRRKLQAGEDVNFDAHAGELSGNVDMPVKNERQDRRLRSRRSGMGMFFDALTGNQVHRDAVALDAMRKFKYNKPIPVTPTPTTVTFSPYDIDYNLDTTGKRIYSQGPQNLARKQQIQQFVDYLKMDEEARKNWRFSGFQPGLSLENLVSAYGSNPQAITDAWSRVESDTATDDDEDLLKAFGISFREQPKEDTRTPEQRQQDAQKVAQQFIDESGLDVEAANRFGITLGEDNLPDFSKLSKDRLHIFSKYSPFSKGKYFGGAVYNGKYYSPEEVQTDATIQSILSPYKEQIAKGDYRDTGSINFHWGENPEYQEYDPRKGYFAEFHDYLLPQDGKLQRFANLAPRYQTQEGEQFIAVPDFSGGTDVYGHAIKTKYLTYNPQTGVRIDYNNPLQARSAPDLSQQVTITPWGDRYKNKERYAHVFNSGPYDFYVGEKDQRLYVRKTKEGEDKNKGGDYYLVQDFDIYNKIKQGESVSREDIDKIFKGKTGKIIQSENKWWADDNTTGYRYVGGSGRNSPLEIFNTDASWIKFLSDLDTSRETALGKGRKYQYGGAFRGLDTTQKKTSRDKQELPLNVADVTQTAVLGSGEGLNANDKLELASMASDLAGLGLSFIPGAGNIAGGVAGVAGTGMQFAADVGRDGLDWGDVGRGAANLGLDALTFIPGLGTAAKAGKVVRNIRRIGNTVLKTLALGSAGSGAYTAAQKIISGDKWTMDDLRVVVAGLQGGVAAGRSISTQAKAGKQWKNIKNAEIAKSNEGITEGGLTKKATLKGIEETTITKGKGKKKTTTTSTNEINKDLELKLNDKDIEKFNALKGEDAKNEFIASKLKADYNFTPTSDQTKSLTEAFNIPKDKKLGFTEKLSVTTKKGKLEGETKTKPLTTRQAYKQVSRGFSFKNKDVRNAAIEATQPFINRSSLTKASRNPLAGPRSLWEVGQSPWRSLQITRTGEDSNKALERQKAKENQYREYKKGGQILKFQTGNSTRRLEDMNAISDWGNVFTDWNNRIFTQADLDILNKQRQSRIGIGNATSGKNVGLFQSDFNKSLLSPIISHVAGKQGYGKTRIGGTYDINQNGDYNVDNILGGITRSWVAGSNEAERFAQSDRNTSNMMFDPNANNGQGAFVFRPLNPVVPGIDPMGVGYGSGTTENPIVLEDVIIPAQKATTTGGTTSSNAATGRNPAQTGHWTPPQLGFDPDNLLAAGSLVSALSKTNRQSRIMKKAIQTAMGSLESSPFEVYPRFTDYGVNAAYENAAQQQLGVKPATSDYLTSYAIEQDAKNKAEQLRLEGRLKTSELFSNYLNRTDDLRRNYAGMRTDVANRNRQRMAQLNMALAENETARLANNYTSWNNFIMEKRNRLAEDRARSERYDEMELQAQLQNHAQQQVADFVQGFQNDYNAEIAANPALKNNPNYATLDAYARFKNPTGYTQKMQEINLDLIRQKRAGSQRYGNLGQLFSPFWMKGNRETATLAKGGKVSKSKSLNAAEQIWVNQNKDVADAVKQINKNVLTLFLKATT